MRASLLLILVGCAGGSDDKADTSKADTGDEDTMTGTPSEGVPSVEAYVMQGAVTWNLSFDEEGEANGYTDCSYSRTFEGLQTLELDYLCPDCEIITRGVSTMTSGSDCYASVFDPEDAGDRFELWGVDEAGNFYRTGRDQSTLGQLAEITPVEGEDIAISWESDYTLTAGGAMTLAAVGTFRYDLDPDQLLVDPWAPRTEPYLCGWPQNDPGTLTLDYTLTEGGTFPNVHLKDQCGERVSLWDFYGSYLIIDSSQPDCGPCRNMAAEGEAFKAQMEEEGIPVHIISFLGNGLSDPMSTPSEDTLMAWVDDYGITEPVLYDQGFGYAMFPAFSEEFTGEDFGYPVWFMIDPDMRLSYANIGFSSWEPIAELIRADWEDR